MSNPYSTENIGNAGFTVDSRGNGRVAGDGGSVTVGQAQDSSYPNSGYISINTGGGSHSTYVSTTDASGAPTLVKRH